MAYVHVIYSGSLASQSVCDSSGRTALDYAIERGYHYCALLLSRTGGADEPELG